MSDDEKPKEPLTPERARQLILSRRATFLAAALAGLNACGEDGPQVCLSLAPHDGGQPTKDGGPKICLSVQPQMDAGPRVCLTPPRNLDAGDPWGADDAGDAGDAGDGGPQVCLTLVVRKENVDDDGELS